MLTCHGPRCIPRPPTIHPTHSARASRPRAIAIAIVTDPASIMISGSLRQVSRSYGCDARPADPGAVGARNDARGPRIARVGTAEADAGAWRASSFPGSGSTQSHSTALAPGRTETKETKDGHVREGLSFDDFALVHVRAGNRKWPRVGMTYPGPCR